MFYKSIYLIIGVKKLFKPLKKFKIVLKLSSNQLFDWNNLKIFIIQIKISILPILKTNRKYQRKNAQLKTTIKITIRL